MQSSIFVFALLFALASAASAGPAKNTVQRLLDSAWNGFKSDYSRSYDSAAEEIYRRKVFENNIAYILKHNKEADNGLHTYWLGVNEYADLTFAEFKAQLLGVKRDMSKRVQKAVDSSLSEPRDIPSEVDWRPKGYVTEIKNQGQCGSCWSFSATGSLEGQHFKATGNLVSLSEQNLVDCSTAQGNQGCNGGLMDQAFEYIRLNNGVDTEASYPYEARDGKCRFNPKNVGATLKNYTDIPTGDEKALATAVATVGPISVAIDASHVSFQLYKKGVYNERRCSSTELDHGVLAVGYGTTDGKDFWIVKNSWGDSWGEKGYIQMSRNDKNQCGIATAASYPVV